MRDFSDKIEKLRKIYTGPGNAVFIDQYAERLQEIIGRKNLVERDDVKALVNLAKSRIVGIDALLSGDAGLDESKRSRLFGEKDALSFWISRFDAGYLEQEAKKLEQKIDESLK